MRFTVTAALPYANGPVHIGHIAGCYLPADIFVRYLRLRHRDVLFICGSDEHGVPITLGARKEGITPQQFVDKYHHLMKSAFEGFGIAFDIYSRTSNPTHHDTAQAIFLDMYNKGSFTEETSKQYFDEKENIFLADRYIVGTCPVCGNENAYGDQCERCGSSLSPKELINPHSALSGATPIMKETRHWYLPLQNYESWLRTWILEGHKDDWKANVYGQCKSWLDNGLQPRAMTRDLEWGVKVPLPGAEGKVLYVWFDAPIGYISATKEYFLDKHQNDWEKYWKKQAGDDDAKLIHFIGKDNIVFHCIIFPAILKAAGDYILPDNVPANEFLNLEGNKISTSRKWAVWLHEYLEDFPGMQDTLRYMLAANMPETKDNDFTWKDFQTRHNSELVAILGNFVNRTIVLTEKYFGGKVPPHHAHHTDAEENALMQKIKETRHEIEKHIENYHFRDALTALMDLSRAGNKYLADKEPWKLINTDVEKTGQVLHVSLQLIANLSLLMQPYLPHTAAVLFKAIGLDTKKFTWEDIGTTSILQEGSIINNPGLLFRKIEDDEIKRQVDKLQNTQPHPTLPKGEGVEVVSLPPTGGEDLEGAPTITYDDFAKLDIRVGTIESAEKVKNADKLLKLQLNMGDHVRTVVSGIALHYSPEAIIGQQVCVVANLAPRKLKGIESQGMILMAEDADGKLVFVNPKEAVKSGSKVS